MKIRMQEDFRASGVMYAKGAIYAVTQQFGESLVSQGFAVDVDGVVPTGKRDDSVELAPNDVVTSISGGFE